MSVEKEFSQDPIFASPGSNIVDGSEARVTKMNEYDVQMASTGSANEAPGDYSKRMRDKKIMLAQYPGPDAKRFYTTVLTLPTSSSIRTLPFRLVSSSGACSRGSSPRSERSDV